MDLTSTPTIACTALSVDEKSLINQVFDMFDLDESGTVRTDDLPHLLQAMGFGADVMSYADVLEMQKAMDPKRTGEITFDAFDNVMKKALHKVGTTQDMWKAFLMFDKEGKGFISLKNLEDICHGECDGVLNKEECRFIFETLRRGSLHRQGITFDDFKVALGEERLKMGRARKGTLTERDKRAQATMPRQGSTK